MGLGGFSISTQRSLISSATNYSLQSTVLSVGTVGTGGFLAAWHVCTGLLLYSYNHSNAPCLRVARPTLPFMVFRPGKALRGID